MASPAQNITVEFQGGEPSLEFDKIIYTVEAIKIQNIKRKKTLNFVMCTNLLNTTDDMLTFYKENNILISTSLDGPKDLHNTNRILVADNSYQLTTKNIEKARMHVGIDNVSALMTTTKSSLGRAKDIVNSYIDNNFTNIFIRELNPYGYSKSKGESYNYSTDDFLDFYIEVFDYIMELNVRNTLIIEDYAALILKKILTPYPISFVDLQSPSGIINGVVVYNHDGYIYASDEGRMLAEEGDFTLRIGHVSDDYNDIFLGKKVMEISNHWANESYVGCVDCAYQPYCGADPVRNYSTQGDFEGFRVTSDFCKKNMQIIDHIFKYLKNDYNTYFPIFQSWITNRNRY